MKLILSLLGLVGAIQAVSFEIQAFHPNDVFSWNQKIRYAFVTKNIYGNAAALPSKNQEDFRDATNYIRDNTCIDFEELKNVQGYAQSAATENVLQVFRQTGVNCAAGKSWNFRFSDGQQSYIFYPFLNVADCNGYGLIHELLHSLGSAHENSRPDAKDFAKQKEQNFAVNNVETFGFPFDFFSMVTNHPYYVNPYFAHSQHNYQPSFLDMLGTNAFNGCLKKCRSGKSSARCLNGGYPHPRDCSKCVCPHGLVGKNCELKPQGSGSVILVTSSFKEYTLKNASPQQESVTVLKAPAGSSIEFVLTNISDNGYHEYSRCNGRNLNLAIFSTLRAKGVSICAEDQLNKPITTHLNEVPLTHIGEIEYKFKVRSVPKASFNDGSSTPCVDFFEAEQCSKEVSTKKNFCSNIDVLDFHPCRKTCNICRK